MHKPYIPNQKDAPNVSTAVESSCGHDKRMRRFIRHPSSIPIHFNVLDCGRAANTTSLVNVSRGGLCFESANKVRPGSDIHIDIPIEVPSFEIVGTVAWCKSEGDHYEIGMSFDNQSADFSVRMVEQVCYIEHYRNSIAQCEGRKLTSEEAAMEWVAKYAADFHHH